MLLEGAEKTTQASVSKGDEVATNAKVAAAGNADVGVNDEGNAAQPGFDDVVAASMDVDVSQPVRVEGVIRFEVDVRDLNGEPYSLLNRLRLGQYADTMVSEGYDDVVDLLRMSDPEVDEVMEACCMPKGHRRGPFSVAQPPH